MHLDQSGSSNVQKNVGKEDTRPYCSADERAACHQVGQTALHKIWLALF